MVGHKLFKRRSCLNVGRANNVADYDRPDMKKWMKCIFPVSLKKETANASKEINKSISVLDEQIDATDSQIIDARKALRLLVATGGQAKELNVAIAEVDSLVRRVQAKTKIRRNLQDKLSHLGDVEINSQVISAMRSTNGALSVAYGDPDEQEDDALDLVEEFELLAETSLHVTGALETSLAVPEPEDDTDHEVDEEALSRAMGCTRLRQQAGVSLSVLPEVPSRHATHGVPADDIHDGTNATRAEIRALRL